MILDYIKMTVFKQMSKFQLLKYLYLQQQFLIIMQKLLSRKKNKQTLEKIQNLSPQKYGRAAFCELSFTPSKLSDNVLYKQVTTMKRIQEQSSRCRQLQNRNKFLSDQVQYLKRERDGIESSLHKMIEMYKKIISNMQHKNEDRLKAFQQKFKQQTIKIFQSRQQQAKYIQAQKQCLQQKIQQLQSQIQELKKTITLLSKDKSQIILQMEQQKQKIKDLNGKKDDLQMRLKETERNSKEKYEELKSFHQQAQINWKNNFNQQIRKKNQQIQRNIKEYKAELQNKQQQKIHETKLKDQQINEFKNLFQGQLTKMKQILLIKQKMIQNFTNQINISQANLMIITKNYQNSTSALVNQNDLLKNQINILTKKLNQQEMYIKYAIAEYSHQIEKIKDMYTNSAAQLDNCRSELVNLAKDNQKLITRVRSSEDQAKTWRQSYYLSKTPR